MNFIYSIHHRHQRYQRYQRYQRHPRHQRHHRHQRHPRYQRHHRHQRYQMHLRHQRQIRHQRNLRHQRHQRHQRHLRHQRHCWHISFFLVHFSFVTLIWRNNQLLADIIPRSRQWCGRGILKYKVCYLRWQCYGLVFLSLLGSGEATVPTSMPLFLLPTSLSTRTLAHKGHAAVTHQKRTHCR